MKSLLISCTVLAVCATAASANSDDARRPEGNAAYSQPVRGEVVAPNRLAVPEPPEEIVEVQTGLASWYGGKFQGRQTASGEIFDTNELTAAHKELPFGTQVRVVNPDNGESVVVTINDRGPFVEGRIIDLSRAAADAIGISGRGVARVRLEVLETPEESTLHMIQVGSFSNPENAFHLVEELQGQGIPAEVHETDGGLHRVILSRVPAKALSAYRERLSAAGYSNVLVRAQPKP